MVEDSSGRHWVLLLAQEMIDPQLPPATFQAEMIEPMERAMVDALAQVCPELSRHDAQLCMHSLVGQLVHVVHLQRCLPTGDGRWELPELVAHAIRFSAAGIRALSRQTVAA